MSNEKRILLVDDNPSYRSAVTRNLTMAGYHVIEAEHADEGMTKIQTDDPQAIITDLDMRTHDEGLHFIKEVKQRYPHIPMILISAVGTFDEGALARQYGAMFVLSKSRIDAEIDTLYKRLDQIYEHFQHLTILRDRLDEWAQQGGAPPEDLRRELGKLMRDEDLDSGMKREVYEMLDQLETHEAQTAQTAEGIDLEAGRSAVADALPEIGQLNKETQTMLSVAESMQQSESASNLSVARNVCFSYSFAVENEVKKRINKKVNRLLSGKNISSLADDLYDIKIGNLDIFFSQYLIRTVQRQQLELNADITRQVMERILKHGPKYKPDGLKALGVILFCWGRNHEFTNRKGKIKIQNPLGIKGLTDETTTQLAGQLILLQHLRNPFIHPEFSEREKIESVRKSALQCLAYTSQIV